MLAPSRRDLSQHSEAPHLPEARLAVQQLENTVQELLGNSLATSTHRTYASAQAQYIKFCTAVNKPPSPATEQTLVLFVAYMAQSCCHATIRVYLSAIRHFHITQGLGDPLTGKLQLQLVLRGVRRKKPSLGDARLPITPLILQAILSVVQAAPHEYTNIMMWAACCLGFFAFLRCGEFMTNAEFDTQQHLSDRDIAVDNYDNPSLLSIHLKQSKTDQDRVGITLYVGRTLSRQALISWLRSTLSTAGIDSTHFSGHSFRIGAASTAAARGVAESTIQTLGRWKSESFRRYIRIPREELATISSTIAT